MSEKNLIISIYERVLAEDKKNLYVVVLIVFIFLFILYIIISKLMNKNETFDNDNIAEQKMFQNMTHDNQNHYLEMTDEDKKNMLTSWIKK
jgi:hypothetical protein